MTAKPEYRDIAKYSGSVGLLVDRAVKRELPFGTVWLVDRDVAVTCAHHVVLYQEILPALKVSFPAPGQDWSIVDLKFHPRFDLKIARELADKSMQFPVSALALQDNNLVILKLSRNLNELDDEQRTTFNRKLAVPPLPRVKGLVGDVDQLGLALVIQTMANSRKDGVLYIADERNRPVASLYCSDGRVLFAKFGRLYNEMAIYQMFIQNVTGQFNFRTNTKPDWNAINPISRPVDVLLLEAHRRLDEIPNLLDLLGGKDTAFFKLSEGFDPGVISPELRPCARNLWAVLDGGVTIGQMWESVDLDDYTIFAVMAELLRCQLVARIPDLSDELNPMQPLEMGPHQLLSPWNEVISLMVDPHSGRPQMRKGNLVGLLRPNDPYHILHTIGLPNRGAGSPIFKDGQVIGLYNGLLPLDPDLHALPNQLHQLTWVEAVHQTVHSKVGPESICANEKPVNSQAKRLEQSQGNKAARSRLPEVQATPDDDSLRKSLGMVRPAKATADAIVCPKCNARMVKQARFCGTCGQKLN